MTLFVSQHEISVVGKLMSFGVSVHHTGNKFLGGFYSSILVGHGFLYSVNLPAVLTILESHHAVKSAHCPTE